MTIVQQRTLKNSIHCSGIGLHSGEKVAMTLHPAEPGSGIRFRRSDITGGGVEIEANWRTAVETPLCTTIVGSDGTKIVTIEHLMSALYGCGIDNAVIELNGSEVPAMDGSAAPFVFLIECAGTVEQNAPRKALLVTKHVAVHDPHRSASLTPGSGFSVHFEIDFDSPVVARQEWYTHVTEASYKREISRARTFGFLHEADRLRAMGYARGGSLDNAIVISGDKVLNDGGLRFDDEFVRHKVLDSIGDLYLVGAPIVGHFHALRAGHSLTLRLLKELMADENAWEWIEMNEAMLLPAAQALPEAAQAAIPLQRAVAASA